jgi:thiamine biosynthesis lipoprotein
MTTTREPGQSDLGATAKAWAADRSARLIAEATGCGALVNLGGDPAVAGPAPEGGRRVAVADGHRLGGWPADVPASQRGAA